LVEVCKNPNIKSDKPDRIADFFENDYILLVNLDKNVGTRARQLMMAGLSGLKPQDACHLAAAALANAEELHTFDRGLLALDGQVDKIDGTRLKICKPGPSGPVPPLLQLVAGG
jgi:predicted nucleic acid-binding protein